MFASSVLACSFAPGYRDFALSSTRVPNTGPTPPDPDVSLLSVERGYDDGNGGSCSDAGVITLEVGVTDFDPNIGYIVAVESGNFPKGVLPDGIISPVNLADGRMGFYFVWGDFSDLGYGKESIDAVLLVRSVSSTGIESDAIKIQIKDP